MRKDSREAKEAGLFVDVRRLDGRDFMPAKALADNVQAARQRGIAEGAVGFAGEGGPDDGNERFLRIRQLGLGFGEAPEILPIVSLERCMDGLRREHVEAHRPRSRAPPAHTMRDCLPRILRHQRLELAFGPLMIEEGLVGVAE